MQKKLWPLSIWLGLIGFIIFSRYVFRFPYLYSWDSVQFALSIKEFDVLKHQPHPPGYIFYSAALKVLHHFIDDANEAMIFMNVAASIFACFFIYLVVYELTHRLDDNRRILLSFGAAAIYATNPIAWFYGFVSEIYAVEGFLVAVLIYLLVLSKRKRSLLPLTSIVFGIAGGVRLTTELFLLPVYILVLWGTNKRTLIISLLCLLIANLFWFIPVVYLSKGLEQYLNALFSQGMRESAATAGFNLESSLEILMALIQGMTIPIVATLILGIRKIRIEWSEILLLVALVPALLFFLFLHFPKYGYLLATIPTLVVFSVSLLQKLHFRIPAIFGILLLSAVSNYFIFTKPPVLTTAEVRDENSKKILYDFTFPNKHVRNVQAERLRMFFQKISELGKAKKLFVIQPGEFPNFRTIMFYCPGDTVVTVRSRKRVTFAINHTTVAIPKPVLLNGNESLIVVIGPRPKRSEFHSVRVYEHTFYYAQLKDLPRNFQVYSIRFAQ